MMGAVNWSFGFVLKRGEHVPPVVCPSPHHCLQ
jgi:hypothetical protein